MPTIPEWHIDTTGQVNAQRDAEHWQPLDAGRIACDLCYRRCVLAPGAAGWCNYRTNAGGRMVLKAHGVVSRLSVNRIGTGSGGDAMRYYRPGAKMLIVGQTHCTAACTFCHIKEAAYRPETLPWQNGAYGPAITAAWHGQRAMAHPQGLVNVARGLGCALIVFEDNEPTLTIEYTRDTARLAQAAGIETAIYTNGFSTSEAIAQLAPSTAYVIIGVKGSADPAFYDRHVRAVGAAPHVLEAIRCWHAAGVPVHVVDVVPPPHLQTDDVAETAQERFYRFLASELGPLATLDLTAMKHPRNKRTLLVSPNTPGGEYAYVARMERAAAIARVAGLHYVGAGNLSVTCHACGGLLLKMVTGGSVQRVAAGHCKRCGAAVPVQTLARGVAGIDGIGRE